MSAPQHPTDTALTAEATSGAVLSPAPDAPEETGGEPALPDADLASDDAVLEAVEGTGGADGADEDADGDSDDLLVQEGDVAGDYLERLLDILDKDGDIGGVPVSVDHFIGGRRVASDETFEATAGQRPAAAIGDTDDSASNLMFYSELGDTDHDPRRARTRARPHGLRRLARSRRSHLRLHRRRPPDGLLALAGRRRDADVRRELRVEEDLQRAAAQAGVVRDHDAVAGAGSALGGRRARQQAQAAWGKAR